MMTVLQEYGSKGEGSPMRDIWEVKWTELDNRLNTRPGKGDVHVGLF